MRLKRKGVLAFQNAGTPFLFNPKSGISDQHHIGKDCHAGQNTVSFCYCIINSKGIVISICEVFTPDTDAHLTEINITMRTHHKIHLLAIGIGIIPISLALRIHIQSEGKLS